MRSLYFNKNDGKIVFSENKDELIYKHGIIRCKKNDLEKIDRSYILATRESSYGAEAMIKDVDAFKKRYREFIPEKATIEEIMLFISRGRKG